MENKVDELLQHLPVIINIGVRDFALSVQTQGAPVIHVDWSPPASGDEEMLALLDKLL
jgi:FdrA protein